MARVRMLLPSIDGKTKQKTRILELSLYSRNGSDNHATRIVCQHTGNALYNQAKSFISTFCMYI